MHAAIATTDPEGREVVFDTHLGDQLMRRRPHVMRQVKPMLETVRHPDLWFDEERPGREHFYRRESASGRWLRVVVDFNQAPALVVTVLVQDNRPGGRVS